MENTNVVKTAFDRLSSINPRKSKLANNTYLVRHGDHFGVRLHNTEVIKVFPDKVVLNSGGWKTDTTKARINDYLPDGFGLYQTKSIWYLINRTFGFENAKTSVFKDGIAILEDGSIEGAGADADVKLKARLNKYVNAFATAFANGEIEKPSGGDCWGCCMKATDGSYPMGSDGSHFTDHIAENYFVPTLLYRAVVDFRGSLSIAAQSDIAEWLAGEKPRFGGITKRNIATALKKFLNRELGYAF